MPFLIAIALILIVQVVVVIIVRGRKRIEPHGDVLPDGAEGLLSTEFLAMVANPKRISTIRSTTRGKARMDVVEEESDRKGVVGVLTICVDPRGVIALRDGHHRLLYALDNGIEILPVKILQSRGIRSHGRHISEVLPLLLQNRRKISEREKASD